MIVRRFSRAIREQNWFAVVLEILIVVIGIFLGLQVDDWNEARKDRQQESLYLAKIQDDLTDMRAELVGRVRENQARKDRMTSALYALEACDTSDQAKSDVRFTLESYQISPPIRFLDATYNEMVASGALARLHYPGLKQKIANTYSALGQINSDFREFRVSMPNVDVIVWRDVSYSLDKGSGHIVARFDMSSLCKDDEFRNAVVEMIDIQHDGLGSVRRALASIEDLLSDLGADTSDTGS